MCFILKLIISRTTEKTIASFVSPSIEMEKKIAPPLPPKASVINEKSKSSPSSKNLMKKLEENIQLQPLQPALKKRYGFIFVKKFYLLQHLNRYMYINCLTGKK